jgi:hypothetical protein
MTLDFYAGALIAIDSAKTLGSNRCRNLWSRETKNNSAVAIIQNKILKMPMLYWDFIKAETAAQLLSMKNVPVISPLSKI